MRNFLLLLLFVSPSLLFGQHHLIEYTSYFGSQEKKLATIDEQTIAIASANGKNYISNKAHLKDNRLVNEPYIIIESPSTFLTSVILKTGEQLWQIDSTTLKSSTFKKEDKTKKIAGYTAQLYTTDVNSNRIHVWVTNDIAGNVGPNTTGIQHGVVLEYIVNEHNRITATKITKLKTLPKPMQHETPTNFVNRLDFRDKYWKSLFIQIPIFDSVELGFKPNQVIKDKDPLVQFAGNGSVIYKAVTFPKFTDTESIFLEVNQSSAGDAYDRTGTVFFFTEEQKPALLKAWNEDLKLLPAYPQGSDTYHGTDRSGDYQPVYELMRFFTSFGAGKFSSFQMKNRTWATGSNYKQDISEYSSLLDGKTVYVGMFIGTWTEHAHLVSANISLHPEGNPQKENVIALFNTVAIMEMAGSGYPHHFLDKEGIVVEFELEKDVKDAQFRFTTTGHGGHGDGDEFVPKMNRIRLDDQGVFQIIPWRSDCATYRNQNPVSGNFPNGLSSSDISRSNWCPGQVTNPYWIPLGDLKAGKHKLQLIIDEEPSSEGKLNMWFVSGQLFY